jgi:toxin ParE1/3/4
MAASFESEAFVEYREAALYSENRFGLGEEFIQAVEKVLEEIEADPSRGRLIGRGVRMLRLRRFPFSLFYRVEDGGRSVTVYAPAHHSREPRYWRRRIS